MHDTRRTSPQDWNQTKTALPSAHRLKSMSVIGGFLDGVRLDLADGLNCVIGARGTGKTTTLELVRYAIDGLPSRDTSPAEHKRIESVIQQNLAGGRVEVEVVTKDGLEYTITRSWGEEPIVLTADGSPTAISLAKSGIFKADIFSQNEVERIADRATCQLALIDNFEHEAIAQIDAELKRIKSKLAANATRIIPLQDKLAALGDELETLPSVEEKLKRFSMADGEHSGEVDQAHALKALRDRERRAVDGAGTILQTAARDVASLTGQVGRQVSTLFGADITEGPNGPMVQGVVAELRQCGKIVDGLLERARSQIAGAQEELARRAMALATAHKEQVVMWCPWRPANSPSGLTNVATYRRTVLPRVMSRFFSRPARFFRMVSKYALRRAKVDLFTTPRTSIVFSRQKSPFTKSPSLRGILSVSNSRLGALSTRCVVIVEELSAREKPSKTTKSVEYETPFAFEPL